MDLTSLLLSLNDITSPRTDYVRGPFNYPGSKASSIKHILQYLPYRDSFIEVCGGTGAVLLARNASRCEVFNEVNSGIVSLYRCIRDVELCKQLSERLELTPPASAQEFLWSRDTWEHDVTNDVERAARWYYSVAHSFNGKGVSFGRSSKSPSAGKIYENIKLFWPIHNRIKNVTLENLDWRQCFNDYKHLGRSVVWYVDPPYWTTTGYYKSHWIDRDYYEFCERIQSLNGGFVAVSDYDSPLHPYNKYTFWTDKVNWEVSSGIEGHIEGQYKHERLTRTETLWIYDPKE